MKKILLALSFITSIYANAENSSILMGANALYWEETDKLRSEDNYIETLKNLNIQTMRFPGGEVADNYDWRTNTLNNPKRWPKSENSSDSINRMDFNEFIHLQKKIGSEPIIVVNLENGFVTGDLEEAANIAAEWVKYSNIEMKYNVKYWEIGNESSHMPTRYPLSAKEYAEAFNLFYEKMKKIDPSIKIGANGPFKIGKVAIYDRLTLSNQKKVRKIRNGQKRRLFAKKLLSKQNKIKKLIWWDTLFKMCNNIDFIALHHYITVRKKNSDMHKKLNIKQNLRRFNKLMYKKINKKLPIFITEWNVGKKNKLNKKNYLTTINTALKEFKEANVKLIHFWPLRQLTITSKSLGLKELFKLNQGK